MRAWPALPLPITAGTEGEACLPLQGLKAKPPFPLPTTLPLTLSSTLTLPLWKYNPPTPAAHYYLQELLQGDEARALGVHPPELLAQDVLRP